MASNIEVKQAIDGKWLIEGIEDKARAVFAARQLAKEEELYE